MRCIMFREYSKEIIGAAGVIIAAVIGLFVKNKIPNKKNITIEQKIERGDNNTQIGIQNNYNKEGK